MRTRILPIAVLVICILGSVGLAQNNTLRGKVRSTDGITVNNAIVELRFSGGGMVGQTVTRNDGDFAFSNLQTGEYEVVVNLAGYHQAVEIARFSQPSRMNFAEVLNIEILIKPKSENTLLAPGTHFAQDVPKTARAAYERGLTRLRDGKSEEAVAAFQEAIAVFNDYFDAQFALGRELFRVGKDAAALEALERARQINDRQDGVYYMFGLVMIRQGKYAVAEYAFREATRINSGSAASHFYRAEALIELAIRGADSKQNDSDLAAAEKELERAWEISNKRLNAVYLQRARIRQKRGDREGAARELETYLKAEPDAKNAAAIKAEIEKLRAATK